MGESRTPGSAFFGRFETTSSACLIASFRLFPRFAGTGPRSFLQFLSACILCKLSIKLSEQSSGRVCVGLVGKQ